MTISESSSAMPDRRPDLGTRCPGRGLRLASRGAKRATPANSNVPATAHGALGFHRIWIFRHLPERHLPAPAVEAAGR